MPVTYLKGAGAAIGRGIEAFEAKQGQQGMDTAPAGGSPFQTGRWVLSHHCLLLPLPRAMLQHELMLCIALMQKQGRLRRQSARSVLDQVSTMLTGVGTTCPR